MLQEKSDLKETKPPNSAWHSSSPLNSSSLVTTSVLPRWSHSQTNFTQASHLSHPGSAGNNSPQLIIARVLA